MKKIIALAALVAISASASAATNLFTDGSFEDIAVAAGTWKNVSQAQLKTAEGKDGWIVTSAVKTTAPIGLEIRNNVAGKASNGSNFIELDGNQNDKISQSLATVVGQDYEITFDYADRGDLSAAVSKLTGGFAYTLNGQTSKYAGLSFGKDWNTLTIDFTAVSSKTVFSIWALGNSDTFGTSFDNFSAVAVPEPATLGLFAAGLAMLGLSARRRQK